MRRLRYWVANWLLKHLFNAVTEDDILKVDGRHLTFRGQPLSQVQVAELKSGAESLQRLHFWQLLTAELQHEANRMMFEKSKTVDDLLFGKAVLYTIEVMKKKINQIANIK